MGEIVDLRDADPRRAGALVLATLAYPGETESALRELTFRRLFNRWLRRVIESEPAAAEQPITVRPIELMMDHREVYGGRIRLENRLSARVVAGHIALPFVLLQEGKPPPKAFEKKPTLMTAARLVLGDESAKASKHLLNRKFRPSLPVIHIAAAWVAMTIRDGIEGRSPSDIDDLLAEPWFLIDVLAEAERLVPVLQASTLGTDPNKLIRFTL